MMTHRSIETAKDHELLHKEKTREKRLAQAPPGQVCTPHIATYNSLAIAPTLYIHMLYVIQTSNIIQSTHMLYI